MKILTLSLITLSFITIGCGGGGGGNSISQSSNGTTFPSTSTAAKPTIENAKKVKEVVTTNENSLILNAINDTSNINITTLLNNLFTLTHAKVLESNYSLNNAIQDKQTEQCSNGGSIVYEIKSNFPQGATMTQTFDHCSIGFYQGLQNVVMNGEMYHQYSNLDSEMGEYKTEKLTFLTDFTIKEISTNETVTFYKNSYSEDNIITFDEDEEPKKYTVSATIKASDGKKQYGVQDIFYHMENLNFSRVSLYQTKGRVYIDNLTSYVDYDTSYDMSQTPFIFTNSFRTLRSGEARYTMEGNAKVKLVANNNNVVTYVDADGDGSYELSE